MKIIFGNGNIGTGIRIKDNVDIVEFSKLDKKFKVGESIKDIAHKKETIVSLCFNNIESIDVVIEALAVTKMNMIKNMNVGEKVCEK